MYIALVVNAWGRRPVVDRFLYFADLQHVLDSAYQLRTDHLALNSSSFGRLKIEGNNYIPYREMQSEKERELLLCGIAYILITNYI